MRYIVFICILLLTSNVVSAEVKRVEQNTAMQKVVTWKLGGGELVVVKSFTVIDSVISGSLVRVRTGVVDSSLVYKYNISDRSIVGFSVPWFGYSVGYWVGAKLNNNIIKKVVAYVDSVKKTIRPPIKYSGRIIEPTNLPRVKVDVNK